MKAILVVEDIAAVQLFLRETLESKGYKTFGANDCYKALEVLANHQNQIGLVLTDYNMVNCTGFEMLKKLKQSPEFENIPFIFLSAESNPEIISNIKSLGLTSWIKKPYRSETLLTEISRVLLKKT